MSDKQFPGIGMGRAVANAIETTPTMTPGILRDIAAILREAHADRHAACCEHWAREMDEKTVTFSLSYEEDSVTGDVRIVQR